MVCRIPFPGAIFSGDLNDCSSSSSIRRRRSWNGGRDCGILGPSQLFSWLKEWRKDRRNVNTPPFVIMEVAQKKSRTASEFSLLGIGFLPPPSFLPKWVAEWNGGAIRGGDPALIGFLRGEMGVRCFRIRYTAGGRFSHY